MTIQETEGHYKEKVTSKNGASDVLRKTLLSALEEEKEKLQVIARFDTYLDEEKQKPYTYIVAAPKTATYNFDEIDQLLLPLARSVNEKIDDLFEQNDGQAGTCERQSPRLYEGDNRKAYPGRLIIEERGARKTFLYLFFDINRADAAISDLAKIDTLSPIDISGTLSQATMLPTTEN